MSREQDVKIAAWAGYKPVKSKWGSPLYQKPLPSTRECNLPKFSTSDADAITLLPVLVEKGHGTLLVDNGKGWGFEIILWTGEDKNPSAVGKTISAAITTAVLALIEREVAK